MNTKTNVGLLPVKCEVILRQLLLSFWTEREEIMNFKIAYASCYDGVDLILHEYIQGYLLT
jgi:hypothetical protein